MWSDESIFRTIYRYLRGGYSTTSALFLTTKPDLRGATLKISSISSIETLLPSALQQSGFITITPKIAVFNGEGIIDRGLHSMGVPGGTHCGVCGAPAKLGNRIDLNAGQVGKTVPSGTKVLYQFDVSTTTHLPVGLPLLSISFSKIK